MKKYFSIIRFFILASVFILTGCVHVDKYDAPDLSGNCQDLKATITLEAAKSLASNATDITQKNKVQYTPSRRVWPINTMPEIGWCRFS